MTREQLDENDNSSKVLKTYDNGIPHLIDDELNYRTGVPYWGCIVDELNNYTEVLKMKGINPDECNEHPSDYPHTIAFSMLVSAVEEYGKALEHAVEELYNLHDFIASDPEFFEDFHQKHSAYIEHKIATVVPPNKEELE